MVPISLAFNPKAFANAGRTESSMHRERARLFPVNDRQLGTLPRATRRRSDQEISFPKLPATTNPLVVPGTMSSSTMERFQIPRNATYPRISTRRMTVSHVQI